MGVPRFFRWVSERYPQIMQNLVDSHAPEYDNLYLDMNGIIHACSQEISNSLLTFSEDELIRMVCNYIDKLFHIIRPTKLLYMAIDGVAPRSKLNQQRQRRFLSVYREEKAMQELKREGKEIPEVVFSRNAITPGTEFMSNLSDSIQFFIKKKIEEDQSWRDIEIIFSGPENPGEGEHKIIDYIRRSKANKEWDPNQAHCLYGLDADLILLSLVTHEPHFSILREEIVFTRTKTKSRALDFQLMHISLLREYMELELKTELPFGYDLERIIDDFILIMILFGNDFLPHLPFCEISNGGLNEVMVLYQKTLPELGGYLTDEAGIDLERFEKFMEKVAAYELKHQNLNLGSGDGEGGEDIEEQANDLLLENDINPEDEEKKKEFERLAFERLKSHFTDLDFEDQDDDQIETYWQNAYYRQKFPDDFPTDAEGIKKFKRDMLQKYVEGLSWVLNYYHNGCISWRWYYPHYYAPLAQDFKDLSSLDIDFETSGPVTPFQQLMSVLPPQSASLLPAPYQKLMTDPSSPIIDFYPMTFEVDTSDSHYFDGIALIGFPDLARLIDATKDEDTYNITPKERSRNTFRNAVIIYHDAETVKKEESPNKNLFNDIEKSSAKTEDIILPEIDQDGLKPFRLCEGVLVGCSSPSGFPTLQSLPFTWEHKHGIVNIWGMTSRKESVVLCPPIYSHDYSAVNSQPKISELKSMLGKKCYVNWPYHIEAKIVGFSDGDRRVSLVQGQASYFGGDTVKTSTLDFNANQKIYYLEQLKKMPMDAIRKGLDLEKVNSYRILVHVQKVVGIEVEAGGRRVKRYSDKEDQYPLQLLVDYDRVRADSRYQESEELPFHERFPVNKQLVYINTDHYFGSIARVTAQIDEQSEIVEVELQVSGERVDNGYGHRVVAEEGNPYFPQDIACKKTGLTSQQLSLLTGGVFLDKPMADIGLNMKFTGRQQQMLGYCRGTTMGNRMGNSFKKWEFSQTAVDLILDYIKNFPVIVIILQKLTSGSDRAFDLSTQYSTKEERLDFVQKIEQYLEGTGIRRQRMIPCDSETLSPSSIAKIEQYYGQRLNNMSIPMNTRVSVDKLVEPASYESVISHEKQHTIMKAEQERDRKSNGPKDISSFFPQSPPTSFHTKSKDRKFNLGDRVVTILEKGNIPFGLFATVVSVLDQKVDIIFDRPCFSGTNLNGACSEKRGLCISKWRLYNLSNPVPQPRRLGGKRPANYQDATSTGPIDPIEHWKKLSISTDEDSDVVKVKIQPDAEPAQQTQPTQELNWQQQQELYKQNQRKNYYQRQEQFVNKFTKEELTTYKNNFPSIYTQKMENKVANPKKQQQQHQQNQQQQQQHQQQNKKKQQKQHTDQLLQQMFDSSKQQQQQPQSPQSDTPPITSFFKKSPPQQQPESPHPQQPSQPQPQQPALYNFIQQSLETSGGQPTSNQSYQPYYPYPQPGQPLLHPSQYQRQQQQQQPKPNNNNNNNKPKSNIHGMQDLKQQQSKKPSEKGPKKNPSQPKKPWVQKNNNNNNNNNNSNAQQPSSSPSPSNQSSINSNPQ